MTQPKEFNTHITPTWCTGCGNFGVWAGIKQALAELSLTPDDVVIAYDIGCSGNMADKINTYAFKSLHGRAVPVACGIKLANQKLKVIAIGGDGGVMEEGINHVMWAARSNYDITVIMDNNNRFALTTGQPTITTDESLKISTSPWGVVEKPINPLHIVLESHAPFVARTFIGDLGQFVSVLKEAISFPGFSFIENMQPCVTFNKINTFDWFRQRVFKVDTLEGYNPGDMHHAYTYSSDTHDKIATGVLYKDLSSIPYMGKIPFRTDNTTQLFQEVKKYPITDVLKEFE